MLRPGSFKISDLIRLLKLVWAGDRLFSLRGQQMTVPLFINIKKNLGNQYSPVLKYFAGVLFLIIPLLISLGEKCQDCFLFNSKVTSIHIFGRKLYPGIP